MLNDRLIICFPLSGLLMGMTVMRAFGIFSRERSGLSGGQWRLRLLEEEWSRNGNAGVKWNVSTLWDNERRVTRAPGAAGNGTHTHTHTHTARRRSSINGTCCPHHAWEYDRLVAYRNTHTNTHTHTHIQTQDIQFAQCSKLDLREKMDINKVARSKSQ